MRNGATRIRIQTAVYFREQPLPPYEAAELERYYKQLRDYYGIPEGQAVFPPKPRNQKRDRKATPDPNARNGASHPWRATIGKEGQP